MPSTFIMFIQNIDPTLLKIGFLEIRWYGLVYAFGFILVYFMLHKKREELGIKKEQIDNLILSLFIGLLVGARLFHFLFDDFSALIQNPLEFFMIWHGGMSFFGALLGASAASIYYLKKINLDWKKFGDVIIIAATIALIFGRIANFINGELVGTPSNLPWCVVFTQIDNICRHPYQIYASLSHVLLLGILLFVNKIKNNKRLKEGLVFFSFLIGYSVLRFLTDFFRDDPRYFGLTIWQYICIITAAFGAVFLVKAKLYKPLKEADFGEKK